MVFGALVRLATWRPCSRAFDTKVANPIPIKVGDLGDLRRARVKSRPDGTEILEPELGHNRRLARHEAGGSEGISPSGTGLDEVHGDPADEAGRDTRPSRRAGDTESGRGEEVGL